MCCYKIKNKKVATCVHLFYKFSPSSFFPSFLLFDYFPSLISICFYSFYSWESWNTTQHYQKKFFRSHMVHYRDNYSVIRISIIRDKRCWNKIIIPIQPFGDKRWIKWNGIIFSQISQNTIFTMIRVFSAWVLSSKGQRTLTRWLVRTGPTPPSTRPVSLMKICQLHGMSKTHNMTRE